MSEVKLTRSVFQALEALNTPPPPRNHRDEVLGRIRKAAAAGALYCVSTDRFEQKPFFGPEGTSETIYKSAADEADESSSDPGLLDSGWGWVTAPLLGALAGSGAGAATSLIRNSGDKEKTKEEKKKDLIRSILLGAGVGTGGGVAVKSISSGMKDLDDGFNRGERTFFPGAIGGGFGALGGGLAGYIRGAARNVSDTGSIIKNKFLIGRPKDAVKDLGNEFRSLVRSGRGSVSKRMDDALTAMSLNRGGASGSVITPFTDPENISYPSASRLQKGDLKPVGRMLRHTAHPYSGLFRKGPPGTRLSPGVIGGVKGGILGTALGGGAEVLLDQMLESYAGGAAERTLQ